MRGWPPSAIASDSRNSTLRQHSAPTGAWVPRATPPRLRVPRSPVLVAQTLHFKAICDAGLPTFSQYMAVDYSRWRASQAKVIAQLENSPDFQKQQMEAKQNFLESRANSSGEEAIEQTAALRQICDQALANVFRTGVPMYGPTVIKPASAAVTYAPPAATAKPTVIIAEWHRHRSAAGLRLRPRPRNNLPTQPFKHTGTHT
jgi:hypothetical protein